MIPEDNNIPIKRAYAYRNFSRVYGYPRCQGCEKECICLYDPHHDEYFSETCGLVIMEQGHCYQSNIYDDVIVSQYLRYLNKFIKHNEELIQSRNKKL